MVSADLTMVTEKMKHSILAAVVWVVLVHCVCGQASADTGLVGCWLFDQAHIKEEKVKDLVGPNDATIIGPAVLRTDPSVPVCDGAKNSVRVTDDIRSVSLPEKEITAEAWIVIHTPVEWGSIVGVVQDNGSFERGWLLGIRNTQFAFALSSIGADDGDRRLTYLTALSDPLTENHDLTSRIHRFCSQPQK